MDQLHIVSNGKEMVIATKLFKSASQLRPILNPASWKILGLLSRKPLYPARIAKELNLHEQKVYYCIKQLKNAGLIEVTKTEELHGALAKYYSAKFDSFALVPALEKLKESKEFSVSAKQGRSMSKELKEFLFPFIDDGQLKAKIVVGNPDPHGEFKARAKDNHLAADLSAFLSSLSDSVNFPLVFLDTRIPSLKSENSNLILLGGPITNKITQQINNKLPIKFVPFGGHWVIKSELSGKEYTEEAVGVIQKIKHPFFKNKFILVVAGNRNAGTRAAITALIKDLHDIIKPNQFDKKVFARVVEGLDVDGDGEIDDIEIKE